MSLLNNVADRMATQYADLLEQIGLAAPPAALNTYLSNVEARVGMQYSDRARHVGLAAVPDGLQTQLNNVANRLAFQYPDRNRQVALDFPVDLIGDTIPPTIVSAPEASFGSTTATVTWTTDEFTTYVFRYGSISGVYTEELSSTQFSKTHQAIMTGISASETYYYQITLTDLSGNQTTSQEYELKGDYYVYLPMIVR
jgi:predicted phage tail protein